LANTGAKEIHYTLAIDALKDIPEGSALEVQFENPMGGRAFGHNPIGGSVQGELSLSVAPRPWP